MPDSTAAPLENELTTIDLRNPYLAGFLAWLVPGLGHFYQCRYHKALLFFLCITPMFAAGCVLTSGSPQVGTVRGAYWSWRSGDMRLWWLVQAPLGVAVIPSWTQAWQINSGQSPMLGRFMAPPQRYPGDPTGVPPVIDELRQKLPHYELGNYLLAFAGLMNLLVIFDAIDGPFVGRRKIMPQT
jgi:hypothetical protein